MKIYDRDYDKKIEITRGDTAKFDVYIDDYEYVSGDTLTFTVKRNLADSTAVISKTNINPLTSSIELSTNDTNLDYGVYVYDIQLNTNDGQVITLFNPSTFEIVRGVTE